MGLICQYEWSLHYSGKQGKVYDQILEEDILLISKLLKGTGDILPIQENMSVRETVCITLQVRRGVLVLKCVCRVAFREAQTLRVRKTQAGNL
jgi:hypothetical protein